MDSVEEQEDCVQAQVIENSFATGTLVLFRGVLCIIYRSISYVFVECVLPGVRTWYCQMQVRITSGHVLLYEYFRWWRVGGVVASITLQLPHVLPVDLRSLALRTT